MTNSRQQQIDAKPTERTCAYHQLPVAIVVPWTYRDRFDPTQRVSTQSYACALPECYDQVARNIAAADQTPCVCNPYVTPCTCNPSRMSP